MKLRAFALLDAKVGTFAAPFFLSHIGHAVRAVADLGSDLSTVVGRHPSDFVLYEVGAFDDATGHLDPLPQLINHGVVASFLPQQAQTALPLSHADQKESA